VVLVTIPAVAVVAVQFRLELAEEVMFGLAVLAATFRVPVILQLFVVFVTV
jgi:hypothetical protein